MRLQRQNEVQMFTVWNRGAMKRDQGFCVHGVMTSTLREIPADARAALLGLAFALTFDLGDYDLPKKFAVYRPLAVGIATEAKRLIDDAESRPMPKSGAQRTAEYKARKRAREQAEVTKVTPGDAGDAVTPERMDERMNVIPPTPKGDGGEKIPPSEVRAELASRRPSAEEIMFGGHAMGVPDEFVKEFVVDMDSVGWVWVNPSGRTVYVTKANWRAVLKGRYNFRQKNSPPRAAVPVGGSQRGVGDVPAGFEGAPVGTELPCPCPQFGEGSDE